MICMCVYAMYVCLGGRLYWAGHDDDRIYAMNTDESDHQVLSSGSVDGPHSLFLYGDTLYVGEFLG